MKLFDGLYLYEIVMLCLGIFLFVVLVLALIYQLMHRRNLAGLLAFFVLSIVMIGYPSIKSVQLQKDGVTIDKTTRELQSDPANPQTRAALEKEVKQIGKRPVSDPATLTRIGNAQFALGDEKEAEEKAQIALERDPHSAEALELQNKITTLHKLDSATTELEKHPDDAAAKAKLQETLSQASRQPTANPLALTKIAKAQAELGQRDKATENVNKALQINPNLTEAKKVQTMIVARPAH